MQRWLVITPSYDIVIPILDDGTGPIESCRDVVEVEAETRKDAIVVGVRMMLSRPREFRYCRDQRSDRANPFTGVKAEMV